MATNLAVNESENMESNFKLKNEVQQITDETGLLALNAVLEAARIGEAGQDFVDEVRQLLLTSNKINDEIKSYFTSSQSK